MGTPIRCAGSQSTVSGSTRGGGLGKHTFPFTGIWSNGAKKKHESLNLSLFGCEHEEVWHSSHVGLGCIRIFSLLDQNLLVYDVVSVHTLHD